MRIRKSLAGVAALAVVGSGLALAAAPAANAFPTTSVVGGCFIDGISSTIAPWTTNQTVTINGGTGAVTVGAGASLNVAYQYAQGPNNGGPDLDTTNIDVTASISIYNGATKVATTTVTSPTTTGVINGANFPGATMPTATLTAPSAGTYTVKVDYLDYLAAFGPGLHVVCTGNSSSLPPAVPGNAATPNPFNDGPGGVNVKQRTLNFVNDPSSPYASTALTVNGPSASVAGVTNLGANGTFDLGTGDDTDITLTSPATIRGFDAIGLTGNGLWTPSTAVSVKVCASPINGTACPPGFVQTLTSIGPALTADATGQLNTAVYQLKAGSFTGLNYIQFTQGANYVAVPINILGDRTLLAGAGNPTAFSGSNWYPGETVTLNSGGGTNDGATVVASSGGAISGTFNWAGGGPTLTATGIATLVPATTPPAPVVPAHVVDSATATLVGLSDNCVAVGTGAVTPCATSQLITGTVNPGSLKQQATVTGTDNADSTHINLGDVDVPLAATDLDGNINTVTVTDTRGGTAGWSLVATLDGDFAGAGNGGSIPAANFGFTSIGCAATAAAPTSTTPTAGTASIGTPAGVPVGTPGSAGLTLCSVASNSAGVGGQYDVTGNVKLTVPAFQLADDYTATLQVTLS